MVQGAPTKKKDAETVRLHPNDICKCGDFRLSHKDGIGACQICATILSVNPFVTPCHEFRLAAACPVDNVIVEVGNA